MIDPKKIEDMARQIGADLADCHLGLGLVGVAVDDRNLLLAKHIGTR